MMVYKRSQRGLLLLSFAAAAGIGAAAEPPAQYKSEGAAGVINIITRKRNAKDTASGSVQASGGGAAGRSLPAAATVEGRVVFAGLTYSFGGTGKDKSSNFEYDSGN